MSWLPSGCWALPSLLCCAAIGSAHADGVHSGRWHASFATETAERQHAVLVLEASQGVWTALAQPERCAGPMPATLRDSGASTFSLSIAASQVDPRCQDRSARLTLVDADTLEGEFEDGRIVRLERVGRTRR